VEAEILALRAKPHRGAVFLAGELGLVPSTVGRVLRRRQVPRLASIDPITGAEVRRRHSGVRYERARPGELLHVDVKELGKVPDGGGWRLLGREATSAHRHRKVEALADEKDTTSAAFLHRAVARFRTQDVMIERVLTDNAMVYRRGRDWAAVCTALGIRRRFTKPGCPWTNGKAERLNRTLLTEFAYARPWTPTTTGAPPSTAGSSTTTLDEPTPPSAAAHPSAGSTAQPDNNLPGHDT
jgi:transposase InsO family protein